MSKFNPEQFSETIKRIRSKAAEEGRLIDNPSDKELREIVKMEPGIKKTIYGSLVAESEPTSRAAKFTKNSVDHSFGEEEQKLLDQCEQALATGRLISIDRLVGNKKSKTVVRLTVPEEFAHLAYGGRNLFIPTRKKFDLPDYEIIFFKDEAFEANKSKPLPEKDITIRLAMLDGGRVIKIVRNSNYIGEYKKGVFAAEDWVARTRRGGIFLHAGCRADYLQSVHGAYRTTGTLLISLSAMGKTTTTCKAMARKRNEKSWLVQDDGGTLMPDGSFHGFEAGGVFVKTEDITPGEQAEIYYGLLSPETVGENICVTEEGDFDFHHMERTTNGRAVIHRRDIMHASHYIDVDKIDNLVLLTRGPLMPALARLTCEQAAAFMILGQAMESSAGDPTQAGRIRSEFFYDPFMAGNKAEHANRFYEIMKGLPHMNYYLLNTGGVGEGPAYKQIRLEYTIAILDSLLRGGLEDWVDSTTGLKVPAAVRTVDDIYFHPEMLYPHDEFQRKLKELNEIRHKALQKIKGNLHPDIRNVF